MLFIDKRCAEELHTVLRLSCRDQHRLSSRQVSLFMLITSELTDNLKIWNEQYTSKYLFIFMPLYLSLYLGLRGTG